MGTGEGRNALPDTVDEDGTPNVIYVGSVGLFGDGRLVVADNYFDKTRRNILRGCRGALLFRDRKGKAYQVKGTLEYHKTGGVFDFMKGFNPAKHPGHAAAALVPEGSYSGARRLDSAGEEAAR
jgi:predicted pyridoxine 5'-phosphate oxidase superfamily flavin-nucleotide-binding protein